MKRFFSLLFVCLLTLSFFGCSKEDGTSTSENTSAPTETTSKVTTTTEESPEITSESTTEETTEEETTIEFVPTTTKPTTTKPTTTKPTTTKPTTTKPTTTKPTTTKPTTTKPTTTKPTQAPTQPPDKTPKLPTTPFTVNLNSYGDSATVTITKIELVDKGSYYEMTTYVRLDAANGTNPEPAIYFDVFDSDNILIENALVFLKNLKVGMTGKKTYHLPKDATRVVYDPEGSKIF